MVELKTEQQETHLLKQVWLATSCTEPVAGSFTWGITLTSVSSHPPSLEEDTGA